MDEPEIVEVIPVEDDEEPIVPPRSEEEPVISDEDEEEHTVTMMNGEEPVILDDEENIFNQPAIRVSSNNKEPLRQASLAVAVAGVTVMTVLGYIERRRRTQKR